MSGRTSGHYTGLWQEWAINLANTLRDASAMTVTLADDSSRSSDDGR